MAAGNESPQELRIIIARLKTELVAVETQLERQERACQHKWGEVEYIPERHPGGYIPGDRECGREMGVDSRPGFHVEPSTTNRWKRVCAICGKTEITERTRTVKVASQMDGIKTITEREVPSFPGDW